MSSRNIMFEVSKIKHKTKIGPKKQNQQSSTYIMLKTRPKPIYRVRGQDGGCLQLPTVGECDWEHSSGGLEELFPAS